MTAKMVLRTAARPSRGSVLIFVLLFLSLFFFLGSLYARHSLLETRITQNYVQNLRAHYSAEGGLEAALKALQAGEGLLGEGFRLESAGAAGNWGSLFEVADAGAGGEGRYLAARALLGGARAELRVEAGLRPLFDPHSMTVEDLDLPGSAGILGNLHVNGLLRVLGPGNLVSEEFSLSGPEAVFEAGASLVLEKYQVQAAGAEDLLPFRVPAERPFPGFNGDFYLGRGFPSFCCLENYLMSSHFPGEGPQGILISGELDTGTLGEGDSFAYHGVIVVTGSRDILLSGRINTGPDDAGNQLVIVAARGQNVRITPGAAGELEIGGTLLIFTGGDICVEGPSTPEAAGLEPEGELEGEPEPEQPPEPEQGSEPDEGSEPAVQPLEAPPGFSLLGALRGRRLSLEGVTFQYAPDISPDMGSLLRGLPLIFVRWLKTH